MPSRSPTLCRTISIQTVFQPTIKHRHKYRYNFKPLSLDSKMSSSATTASSPGFPPPALQSAAEEVASLLRTRNETISVAETAAGGLVSAALLACPGASKIYRGGLTLYTLDSRVAFAGWTKADIETYDGPTPTLVAGLARSVRATLGSTWAVGEVCST